MTRRKTSRPTPLYGDSDGNLSGESLPVGEYTLTATAYAERRLEGAVLGTLEVSFTVIGTAAEEDVQNSPATGVPTISGTARVGQTLEAFTNGISDADGLDDVAYSYQWLADNADIAGATGKTYTPVTADQGTTITVRVTFDDDANNEESLTSAATASVAAATVPADVQKATGVRRAGLRLRPGGEHRRQHEPGAAGHGFGDGPGGCGADLQHQGRQRLGAVRDRRRER